MICRRIARRIAHGSVTKTFTSGSSACHQTCSTTNFSRDFSPIPIRVDQCNPRTPFCPLFFFFEKKTAHGSHGSPTDSNLIRAQSAQSVRNGFSNSYSRSFA
jgi:hypothetical protein